MKAVILAGGKGTRIAEETSTRPKPMVEIGDRPILWHIMNLYSRIGINDFIICAGHKGNMIKEYFANYAMHNSDLYIDISAQTVTYTRRSDLNWRIHVVDTGDNTMTGGRLLRIKDLVKDDEFFCMTYGDGLADVDIASSIAFHRDSRRLATMTVVRPLARFGNVEISGSLVTRFREKPQTEAGLINGGFFVLSPQIFQYIDGDFTVWEDAPLQTLVQEGQLNCWFHSGFWQPMDTLREKQLLEHLWNTGSAPWIRTGD